MQRYIISTVVPGAKPNNAFLKSIDCFIKHNPGTKLKLIESTPLYKVDVPDIELVAKYDFITEDMPLNDHIHLSTIPINPESVDPIMGLERQTQLEGSVIFASPKQRLKSVPSPSNDLPRVIMTPGAVTHPYYRNTRRGIMASRDHVAGAIIVEVISGRRYNFRQIQATGSGTFIDLGVRYKPDGTKHKEEAEALTPGDWHAGFTCPKVRTKVLELIKDLSPKYLFLHDFFDGISVNPYVAEKKVTRSIGSEMSVVAELAMARDDLQSLVAAHKKAGGKQVMVVKSNHDEFLDRWVEEAKYVDDKLNHIIGLRLAIAKAEGKDVLQAGIDLVGPKPLDGVRFLKLDESFLITPKKIECGVHGHKGPNGSRGSNAGLEKSYGNITKGHDHVIEILRGLFSAGTSSILDLGYNKGPSSWVKSICITYRCGSRQLINVIE